MGMTRASWPSPGRAWGWRGAGRRPSRWSCGARRVHRTRRGWYHKRLGQPGRWARRPGRGRRSWSTPPWPSSRCLLMSCRGRSGEEAALFGQERSEWANVSGQHWERRRMGRIAYLIGGQRSVVDRPFASLNHRFGTCITCKNSPQEKMTSLKNWSKL